MSFVGLLNNMFFSINQRDDDESRLAVAFDCGLRDLAEAAQPLDQSDLSTGALRRY